MADLVIDVGANQGEFAIEVAARNPGLGVLAIEPIPELCARISDEARARGVDNVFPQCIAIDATERTAVFHLADHADHGVSSLLRFNEAGLRSDEYWRQRTDLHFERTFETTVRRLDTLPEVVAAERIRFVKIDAQGVDLAVIESLGCHLERTEAGVLEVPATLHARLYADECHDLHSATTRLMELGFTIYGVKPNDPASNEFNLFFCRRGLDPRVVERDLRLRGVRLYDGKHFWHLPSDTLHAEAVGDAGAFHERMARVEEALRSEAERLKTVEAALSRECAETRRLGEAIAERDTRIRVLQLAAGQLR